MSVEIQKERSEQAAGTPAKEELAYINQYAKTPLEAQQVYAFAVRLCDNEVDRDYERFETAGLTRLGELFLGKSGIFDHQWSAKGQTARIYRTEVVAEPGKMTAAGDGYCYLKGWAYLLRTEGNAELIAEIEGGIKKEVSVGCSVAESVCSVCGAPAGTCHHVKGEIYDGKLCFTELREPTDAYEWSFVAVPAQRDAGVLKRYGGADRERITLEREAALGRRYMKSLRREVARLAMLADEMVPGEVWSSVVEKLEEPELQALKCAYERMAAKRFPPQPQLRGISAGPVEDETVFLV